jgi:fatty-acyl-CoA synthase
VLQRHPDVLVAAVSGFSDPVLGEKGRAFIVCRTGHKLTADAVKSHCARSVADYKVPDDVVFLDEIPLLGPGKIDRRALRDLVLTGER